MTATASPSSAPPAQVGTVMLRAAARARASRPREIVPFASERSAGRELERRHASSSRSTTRRSRASTSRSSRPAARRRGEWAPRFVDAGAVVVDNSSRWRMRRRRPARRRPRSTRRRSTATSGIIANPNCSTMQMVVALKPIHDAAGHRAARVSTYQAVSGTGKKAVDELARPVARACSHGEEPPAPTRLPAPDRVQRARRTPATSPTATTTPTRSAR